MLSNLGRALLLLSSLAIPLARAQFISSLPQCVQNCIDQSQDNNCKVTDVACLCRASAGNFLPDLITCMHGECDNSLDNDLLLTPLQLVCEIAGAPIPDSAIRNAENQAHSLASQVTTTVTLVGSSATRDSEATTTVSVASSISTKTVTKTEGTASSSVSSTTTLATSAQAAETSSSSSPSGKTSAKNPETTNSSPFTTTNGNGGNRKSAGNWLGLGVLLAIGCVWF